jgi:hypothetical protein
MMPITNFIFEEIFMPYSLYLEDLIDACTFCIDECTKCAETCKQHVSCMKGQQPDQCDLENEKCIEQCQSTLNALRQFIDVGRHHLKTCDSKNNHKDVEEHRAIQKAIEECAKCIDECTECLNACDKSWTNDMDKMIKTSDVCITACLRCIKACKECLESLQFKK